MVSDEDIQDIFASCYIGDIVDELIEEAKKNGGADNITALVIDPFDEEVAGC